MRGKTKLSTFINVSLVITLVMMIGLPNPSNTHFDNPPVHSTVSLSPNSAPLLLKLNEAKDTLVKSAPRPKENFNQAERLECENLAVKEYESEFCLTTFDELNSNETLITYFDQCATTVSINQYDCHCNFPLSGETKCSQNPCIATLDKCQLAVEQIYESCLSLVGRTIDGASITIPYCSDLHNSSLAQECEAEYTNCKA